MSYRIHVWGYVLFVTKQVHILAPLASRLGGQPYALRYSLWTKICFYCAAAGLTTNLLILPRVLHTSIPACGTNERAHGATQAYNEPICKLRRPFLSNV
ncbi:hypothetical protein C8Q78DRAFT_449337 [Trametes maxima]|nr:hypothetical protein C8Q78DRAFT_449337 [Trametes maxima]